MRAASAIISVPEAVTCSPVDSHQFLDTLALAYHRAVAFRLREEPEAVVRTARENLARCCLYTFSVEEISDTILTFSFKGSR